MPWYAAKIVLECRTGNEAPLCDEQIRVIRAVDPEAAYAAALELGAADQHEYTNPEGNMVSWVFGGLTDLVELPLEDVVSGSEVWSTILEDTPARDLVADKRRLTVFAAADHASLTADELLSDRLRRYSPR